MSFHVACLCAAWCRTCESYREVFEAACAELPGRLIPKASMADAMPPSSQASIRRFCAAVRDIDARIEISGDDAL